MTPWVVGIWLAALLGTLIAIPIVVLRMPADYFMKVSHEGVASSRHPVRRWAGLILKNLVGSALVLLGLVLSLPFVPGQGILTILIGISLLDFPGKRALELRLVRLRTVRAAIDWIRARARRPPLIVPPRPSDGTR